MRFPSIAKRFVGRFNTGVIALIRSPVAGPLIRGRLVPISYAGRRSGRSFTTPVGYRRSGDVVTIDVLLPDAKQWWRNFLEEGGPVTLHLADGDRTGHAVARRDGPRRASVTVQLDR